MMNNVSLVGRLTKDPELRYSPNGIAITRFTLAVNRTFSEQGGERKADFIPIVVFKKKAENVANFLSKGSMAGVTGRIETGSYEGQDGKRIYTTQVIADSVQFLDSRSNGAQPSDGQNGSQYNQQPQQQSYNPQGGNQYGGNNQYSRIEDDPFAPNRNNGTVNVKEDDLPF